MQRGVADISDASNVSGKSLPDTPSVRAGDLGQDKKRNLVGLEGLVARRGHFVLGGKIDPQLDHFKTEGSYGWMKVVLAQGTMGHVFHHDRR